MIEARSVVDADLGAVSEMLHSHQYWPRRGYAPYGYDLATRETQTAVRSFDEALDPASSVSAMVALEGSTVVGAATVDQLPFDSAHFGTPIREVTSFVCAWDDRRRSDVIDALMASIRTRQPGMTTLRIDAGDVHALHGAQAGGFRVLNTVMTYLSDGSRRPPSVDRSADVYRTFDRQNPPDLSTEQKERLTDEASTLFSASRFHGDPRIPAARADALYGHWARQVLEGEWADWTFTCFEDGDPVFLIAFRHPDGYDSESSPVILGEAFGFVSRERGVGIGGRVYSKILELMPSDFLEFPTQARVTPLLKFLPRAATFLSATYVLHGWATE